MVLFILVYQTSANFHQPVQTRVNRKCWQFYIYIFKILSTQCHHMTLLVFHNMQLRLSEYSREKFLIVFMLLWYISSTDLIDHKTLSFCIYGQFISYKIYIVWFINHKVEFWSAANIVMWWVGTRFIFYLYLLTALCGARIWTVILLTCGHHLPNSASSERVKGGGSFTFIDIATIWKSYYYLMRGSYAV